MSTPLNGRTFFDALVEALGRASSYNKNDQVPPAVVLWPDKERQWEPLIPQLRALLPLLTFSHETYAPEERKGPAYWLRCMIARTLPDDVLPDDATPIIYLPGVSKAEIRAVEDCPRPLQPLAELQYRGVLWTQKNSRDWTVAAFLQSNDGGLGIDVSADNATREALARALTRLASEPLYSLGKEAPLRADFFNALLNPDEVRAILLWLNDPTGYSKGITAEHWSSFCDVCGRKYGFDPQKDGPITPAQLLGARQGVWAKVWDRFAEAPRSYPHLPDLLRSARPDVQMSFFTNTESWPQDNDTAEQALRNGLAALQNRPSEEARKSIKDLEQDHASRRAWVWAALGQSPMATALEHLAALSNVTEHTLPATTLEGIIAAYAEWGWRADAAAVGSLAAVQQAEQVAAVKAALVALYRPWLEAGANAMQKAVAIAGHAYSPQPLPAPTVGTCILFSDGLRFDAAQGLAAALNQRGHTSQVATHLAALPTVTPTAKPALSPVADLLVGGSELGTRVKATDTAVTVDVLRKLLRESGCQVLQGDDLGDPSGRAWTELGDIDEYGHQQGWKIAHHLSGEIRDLSQRIHALLEHGWKRVVVVTDHGWLLLPGGLPKANLPEHLTVIRKGRCARLKEGSQTDGQTVPWYWDSDVRIALAPGIHCYEAGKEYEHGGLSPQECVVPIITVTSQASAQTLVTIGSIIWRGLRCTLKLDGSTPDLRVDIRTKAGDPNTSLVATAKSPDADGAVSLLIQDDDRIGEAVVVVVFGSDGTPRTQTLTTIGG